MTIVVVCVLAYAYVGRVVHADLEVVGIYPSDMLAHAAWPMAATCGLLLAAVCSAMRGRWVRWRRAGVAVVPVAASVACLVAVGPVLARNALAYEQAAAVEAPRMPGSDGTQQYRIALADTTESSWISYLTRVPELGGPFNQGAIDLDWANWAQSVLSNSPPSAAEAEFIAQWNAVRWVEAGPFPSAYGFYQDHPGVFEDLGPSTYPAFHTYLVRRTSPILAATDAPPVLVIGPYEDDNLLLRSLAVTDVGPNHMIPVEGPANLDDYTLAELEQFPEIFLYGFEAGDPVRDAQLLERYVAHGGGLVVDAGGDAALTAQLADDGAPLPVTSWGSLELLDAWHFRPSTSPLVRGIDLAGFAPAVDAGTDPYLVEAARQRVAGSAIALASGDHPVLVDERLGRGLVVESGLNLPYHDAVFSNVAESDLLARMIALAMAPGWVHATPASGIASMAPDSDSLRVGSADGVLFKEADTPGWHVSVDGRAATALPAGPGADVRPARPVGRTGRRRVPLPAVHRRVGWDRRGRGHDAAAARLPGRRPAAAPCPPSPRPAPSPAGTAPVAEDHRRPHPARHAPAAPPRPVASGAPGRRGHAAPRGCLAALRGPAAGAGPRGGRPAVRRRTGPLGGRVPVGAAGIPIHRRAAPVGQDGARRRSGPRGRWWRRRWRRRPGSTLTPRVRWGAW
jgi:hypothetical protein